MEQNLCKFWYGPQHLTVRVLQQQMSASKRRRLEINDTLQHAALNTVPSTLTGELLAISRTHIDAYKALAPDTEPSERSEEFDAYKLRVQTSHGPAEVRP